MGIPDLEGRIVNQVPFPGTTLAKGQTATVVVAVRDMPEGHQGMPSVVGAPVDAAAARLRKAGLAPKMWALPSAPSKRGVVLTQLPLADSIVGPKDEVHLFVGVGGRPETTEGSEATPGPEEPALEPTPPETSAALGVPTLISPSEGQSFPEDYGATFQWTAVRGAQGYEWVLEREAQGGAFGPATSHRVTAPRYRPPRVARGRYRWRVRALRGDQAGPWSVWFRLFMY